MTGPKTSTRDPGTGRAGYKCTFTPLATSACAKGQMSGHACCTRALKRARLSHAHLSLVPVEGGVQGRRRALVLRDRLRRVAPRGCQLASVLGRRRLRRQRHRLHLATTRHLNNLG